MKIYKNEINKLAEILKNNGVISVPTDTVYGLCASINSTQAYNKLIKMKNRPINKNLPIMCSDKEQIKKIAEINDNANKIIDKFMPGPITIILNKKSTLPEYINQNTTTVAIRMATSEALKELIKLNNSPIFMSSANISGNQPCKTINEIEKTFPTLDGILEGKPKFGISSTIIDCTTNEVKLIREGPISIDEIKNILN